jgi:cysteine desulfurase / selenocysteine lyase
LSREPLEWTRREFPLLSRLIDGKPLVYLDSASTTPKPRRVIDAVNRVYTQCTANVHRGVHTLADEATAAYEEARQAVAAFLNASPAEIVFTRNSTEAINIVAAGIGLGPDDEVALTPLEHHSNFLPWRLRARPACVGLAEDGLPFYEEVSSVLTPRTRLLTLAHVSNTAGVVAPVETWAQAARSRGVPLMVDASQSASHLPIDVKAMDCDFLALSGHKLLGPSGIGVLYARNPWLEKLAVMQSGGGMVRYHGEDRVEYQDPPLRFEAGTPAIEGAVGLGAAVEWLRELGMEKVREHSFSLGRHLCEALARIPGVRIVAGSAGRERRIGLASFSLDSPGMDAESVARYLCDRSQIIVSGGYHCAHILHHRLGREGTVRASAHVFNTHDDIDRLCGALRELLA